jgi:hypothetical protein
MNRLEIVNGRQVTRLVERRERGGGAVISLNRFSHHWGSIVSCGWHVSWRWHVNWHHWDNRLHINWRWLLEWLVRWHSTAIVLRRWHLIVNFKTHVRIVRRWNQVVNNYMVALSSKRVFHSFSIAIIS